MVGLALIATATYFVLRRRRRSQSSPARGDREEEFRKAELEASPGQDDGKLDHRKAELEALSNSRHEVDAVPKPVEIDNGARPELEGNGQAQELPAELHSVGARDA